MARLQNKVAVVTGGASGIGLACVRRFAAEGAQVVGLDIGSAPADFPGLFMTLDVRDEAQVQQVMQDVISRFGRIDILVNAAGDHRDLVLQTSHNCTSLLLWANAGAESNCRPGLSDRPLRLRRQSPQPGKVVQTYVTLWRGSLLPLGCEAVVALRFLGSLRDPTGASSLATG